MISYQEYLTRYKTVEQKLDHINMCLIEMVRLLTLMAPSGVSQLPNLIKSTRLVTDTAGVAKAFPRMSAPPGCRFVIRAINAPTANTDVVYIGSSKADAEDTYRAVPLLSGESYVFDLKDTSELWLCSAVAGEGVTIVVEGYSG